jgi:hypothetical protein
VSSSASVVKSDSEKCSGPSERVKVARVEAKRVFCRTGAVLGIYVTAVRGVKPNDAVRRMIYSGVVAFRYGPSRWRCCLNEEEESGKEMASSGTRDSFLIVMGSAREVGSERKLLKADWSSVEAVKGQFSVYYVIRKHQNWPVIPDCILMAFVVRVSVEADRL